MILYLRRCMRPGRSKTRRFFAAGSYENVPVEVTAGKLTAPLRVLIAAISSAGGKISFAMESKEARSAQMAAALDTLRERHIIKAYKRRSGSKG